MLRLDGASEIEVLNLDDDRMVLRLHSGSLAVRIRSADQVRGFELLTEEGRFTVQRPGRYRFDRSDDASFATVLAGQAYYDTQNNALSINAGQRAEFWMDRAGAPQYSIVEPERDAFAGWVAERDRADERSAASRHVSPEMTGVEDLDPLRHLAGQPRVRRAVGAARRGVGLGAPPPAAGSGWRPGAGPGSTRRPGASRPSTTGAGSTLARAGAGHPAPMVRGRSTRRRWWPGSAGRIFRSA